MTVMASLAGSATARPGEDRGHDELERPGCAAADGRGQRPGTGVIDLAGNQGRHESTLLSRQPWRGQECRRLCTRLVDELREYAR